MNKTFEQEWNLYKEGGSRPQFKGEPPRGEAEFDAPVKAGEIRVFADMARPFVALVAEERGVAGWLLVPVSPFTVPASPREALEGERVYQLWNACTAARSFVARSWRVDEMDADVLAELRGRCAARGEFAADGIVAEYEREFLVSGGDFIPLVDKATPRVVRVSWHKIISIAACFAILLGVGMHVMFKNAELGSSQMRDSDKVVVRHAAVVQDADEPLDDDSIKRVASSLDRFSYISVREPLAQKQLSGLTSRKIDVTLDPTLLLTAKDYDEVAYKGNVIREPYLFMYTLSTAPFFVNTAKQLADRLGVKCVIAPCYQYSRFGAAKGLTYGISPDRLVGLARGAKYVLAGSFHGTVMGLMFHKPFLSLRAQIDEYESRPAALLNRLGCENRLVNPTTSMDEMELMLRCEVHRSAYDLLEVKRNESLKWLCHAIG